MKILLAAIIVSSAIIMVHAQRPSSSSSASMTPSQILRTADQADAMAYLLQQQMALQQQQEGLYQGYDDYPYVQRFMMFDDTPSSAAPASSGSMDDYFNAAAAAAAMKSNNGAADNAAAAGMMYTNTNKGVPDGYGIQYDDLVYPSGGDFTVPSPASSSASVNGNDDSYCKAVGKEFGCDFPRKAAEDKCVRCATTGSVDVDGEASVKLTTNLTRIQLGVEYQGSNTTSASDVQNEVSRRAAAVVAILQAEGKVTELSTTAITLSRQYQWMNNQNQFIGYLATNMVSFLLSGTEAGGIIDACVTAGATRIDSIAFEAPAANVLAARKKALTNAIKDAREKAMLIAGTLGVNLLIPPRIDLYSVTAPPATKFSMMSFARGGGEDAMPMAAPMPSSPLIPGNQVITASIRIAFQYTSTTTSDRLPLPKTPIDTIMAGMDDDTDAGVDVATLSAAADGIDDSSAVPAGIEIDELDP